MIRPHSCADDGFTGLELVIVIVVMMSIAVVLLVYLGGGGGMPGEPRTFPGGIVAESAYLSGDNLQSVGSMYAFPRVQNQVGTTRVIMTQEDPGSLGVIRVVVSLFMGDTGAIDMGKVRAQWNRAGGSEEIPRTMSSTLVCPNWTVSNKFNILPGRTADSDDWLEPNEQFELTICPSQGVPPSGMFILAVSPDGVAMPLTMSRTAPPVIQPVMNLG
jgi:hypothetical protein